MDFPTFPPAVKDLRESEIGWTTVPTRLPWRRKPDHRVLLLALELRDGWHYLANLGDGAHAVLAFAQAHRTFEQRIVGARRARDVSFVLRHRHGGVSLRWLSRYLAQRRAEDLGVGPQDLRLRMLRGPRTRWADVPPPLGVTG